MIFFFLYAEFSCTNSKLSLVFQTRRFICLPFFSFFHDKKKRLFRCLYMQFTFQLLRSETRFTLSIHLCLFRLLLLPKSFFFEIWLIFSQKQPWVLYKLFKRIFRIYQSKKWNGTGRHTYRKTEIEEQGLIYKRCVSLRCLIILIFNNEKIITA